ncbi:MAG: nucleoid-associated protein [Saprospiraceae bacterium]
MINYKNIEMGKIAFHRVGNKNRGEYNFRSETLFDFEIALKENLKEFFLKSLRKQEELYQFQSSTELEDNRVYRFVRQIFENPLTLLEQSFNILEYLYAQSDHPNIKSGELFVVHFTDIQLDDELVDAVGIFKAETKSKFFQVDNLERQLTLKGLDGINAEKLDKGCLIINTESADGYRIYTVDNNRYDASYWLKNFLDIEHVRNENFHTRSYLELLDNFSQEVVAPTTDKKEQLKFINDSVDYFASHETFNAEDFAQEVIPSETIASEFKNYAADYGLDQVETFEISPSALKTAAKKIKSEIKLDTKIQIKLDLNNPDAGHQYLEKGFDEEQGMFYYKVYFNEELS